MVRCAQFFGIAGLCLTAQIAVADGTQQLEQPVQVANACAARCYEQENKCRIQTQGSPSCGKQLVRCLNSCRK